MSTIETSAGVPTRQGRIEGIPIVSYDQFWHDFNWKQDQHITIIGTTGCGKTTLELDLIDERDYVIFLGTKEEDETQDDLGPLGFRLAKNCKDISLDVSHRWVLHPGKSPKKETAQELKRRHRDFYQEALTYCFRQTSWAGISVSFLDLRMRYNYFIYREDHNITL